MAETPDLPRAALEAARRAIPDLLARWREAERRLSDAPPRSSEEIEAKQGLELAHRAYREAFDLALRDLPQA